MVSYSNMYKILQFSLNLYLAELEMSKQKIKDNMADIKWQKIKSLAA